MFFRALNKALEKPAPQRFTTSWPGAQENDFYSVKLEDSDSNTRILIRNRRTTGYEALVWKGEQSRKEKNLPERDIDPAIFNLRIEHYYQGYQFNYTDPSKFLLMDLIRWHKIVKYRDRMSQSLYNKKRLVREERMELLRHLVERKIDNPRDEIYPLMLAVQKYSRKWLYHPDKDKHKAHLELVLDSFVESGELIKNGTNYVVTGKALDTLSEFELNVQRHQDQIKTAKVGNRLTWAIVIVGVVGILSRAWMWAIEQGVM
ncbi:hypothetical protein [Halomonas llamarensis]|uniref:Uncharacterized protein n=1 Tax=Halomonas llamarensis TaxID=2945104 RepID=A0ABT0SLT3_9GAMM|nr:hypothetical protein [Halomonas llamarensis]MCL7928767.1 hypothetical protein [Halomonas llamarensis]